MMRRSVNALAAALLIVAVLHSAAPALAAAQRSIRGVVADESGGVLTGVTVTAASPEGVTLATAATNGAGAYTIGPLPVGRVTLTFQLEGFSTASVRMAVTEDDALVNERLAIASQSETVLVHADLPVAPPPVPPRPPPPPPPPPRPRPVTTEVPEHDRDSICGPAKLGAVVDSFGTLQSGRYVANGLYAQGDELVIAGGTLTGLAVGRNFVVRRSYQGDPDKTALTAEHTSGVVQIVEADERTSIAVVMYACDEMMVGDRLASFTPEPIRLPDPAGPPAYDRPARILFADARQLLGVPRRLMVIDQGVSSGLRAGQRLTLFRRRGGQRQVIGDAVVVATRTDSATIRVEHATDMIAFGDWAVRQRPRPGR